MRRMSLARIVATILQVKYVAAGDGAALKKF
jgi:hypothetical protein